MPRINPSDHSPANTIHDIVYQLESFISQCQQTIQTLSQSCHGLSSSDATLMLRGFCGAEVALAALERQALDTRQTISEIHEAIPYPRFVDKLSEDVLSYIFCLAAAEVAPEDVPVEIESYGLLDNKYDADEGDQGVLQSLKARFPEQIVLVNRRWRRIGLANALIWTRIIRDPKHRMDRVTRWLARSQRAPLSVHWAQYAKQLPLLVPHLPRIKLFDLVIRGEEADDVSHFLQHLSSMPMLSRLSLSSITKCRGEYVWPKLVRAVEPPSSLRHFAATSMLLDWTWPIRNLISLQLEDVDIDWPRFRDIFSASPDLQRLTLVNLGIRNYPPSEDDPIPPSSILYHLENIQILDLTYPWYSMHTQLPGSPETRAPAVINLAVHTEQNVRAALLAFVSGGKASLESLGVGVGEEPILDDIFAALTDTPPLRLKTAVISHLYDNPHDIPYLTPTFWDPRGEQFT
ncbi:hypothetical protein FRB95_001641 [Tulasnella sp. JGI-2019a]|nr:hypothetical protein FRB95_001641 [Tulasnella sp. JGI-2019a]